jgi:hypothetical protein
MHVRLGNHANTIRALLLPLAFSLSVPCRPLPRLEATTFPTSLALAQHQPHVTHGNHRHFCADLQTFPSLLNNPEPSTRFNYDVCRTMRLAPAPNVSEELNLCAISRSAQRVARTRRYDINVV